MFWADISTYQPVVDGSYPYPVLGIRADTGSSTDAHAPANWAYVEAHPAHIQVMPAYVVFKPGRSAAILARLKNLFGSQCPPQVVPEIDMESGSGFAGPGDHSTEANDFIAALAVWAGDQDQTMGYANGADWADCWALPPTWMKKRLASYSSAPTPAGYYARQYYGALPYSVPAGYPTSCPPFGAYVDMNVIPRTITQIKSDFGIGDTVACDLTDADKGWLRQLAADRTAEIQATLTAMRGDSTTSLQTIQELAHNNTDGLLGKVITMSAKIDTLTALSNAQAAKLDTITQAINGLADGTTTAAEVIALIQADTTIGLKGTTP